MSNHTDSNTDVPSFLDGGGEMGELTRKFNWSATPLGSFSQWPLSLQLMVSTLLNSRFPMLLFWGPELVQFYNDAFRPSFGVEGKHPKALGQCAIDCWSEIWPTISPLFEKVRQGESIWFENLFLPIFRNGRMEDVYWTFSYSPVRGDKGGIDGIMVICTETTSSVVAAKKIQETSKLLEEKVKERTKELLELNEELEKKNQELASFAYISSHDLQEPLRKINTFVSRIEVMDNDSVPEKQKEYFRKIKNSATHMQKLINDLLSFSRLDVYDKEKEPTDLNALLIAVQSDLSESIRRSRAFIEVQELPTVNVIPYQFRQLFTNLIANAIKFSGAENAPSIKISAETVYGDQTAHPGIIADARYFHIQVDDNGIGFEEQYSRRIFEVFQRLHGKHEYEGTGIGLAICKKVVENHEGFIIAEGFPGKGANFHIYLPATAD